MKVKGVVPLFPSASGQVIDGDARVVVRDGDDALAVGDRRVLGDLRLTKKVSVGSLTKSPITGTRIDLLVGP